MNIQTRSRVIRKQDDNDVDEDASHRRQDLEIDYALEEGNEDVADLAESEDENYGGSKKRKRKGGEHQAEARKEDEQHPEEGRGQDEN